MSPRSIWTACLLALTVFTPMGACAGLPDQLLTGPGRSTRDRRRREIRAVAVRSKRAIAARPT